MNPRIIAAALVAVTLGAGATYLAMRNLSSPPEIGKQVTKAKPDESAVGDFFPAPPEDWDDPFAVNDKADRLSKFSGKWVSADGQQSAGLNRRTLRFNETVDWPDLDQRYFLIGKDMQFMTNSGYYRISILDAVPDMMSFIKEDFRTGDHISFTLYREGSRRARSREPLVEKTPPATVQELLDAIPTIKAGEPKNVVMERLGLVGDDSLELLGGERSMGYTDMIFGLGIDNGWMLRLDFSVDSPDADDSDAVIRRFQIIRGYIGDVREGRMDVQKLIYPYFADGYVVVSPTLAKQADASKPTASPEPLPIPKAETRPEPTPETSTR